MKCPNCAHENAIEAKFCEQCATPLTRTCGHCGNPVSPVAKFCSECGRPLTAADDVSRFASPRSYTPQHLADKILAGRAMEGERKQVTVLFADIKGSMELFVGRDAEAVQKLFEPVLDRMIEAVHFYEGTVNRVLGDGIMALFGAPIAHEDHAVRACYAALRMQERVKQFANEIERSGGTPVTIRIGLNSGEIVVCGIGNDLYMDYTVVGQAAHLASRLEQMAKPGTVLTSADTLMLAEGYIATAPLGAVPVKGLIEPINVYEVTGVGEAKTRLDVASRRGLTPFVGRELELEQLHRAQQLAAQGHGQVVGIVGEAGVGKSRLVREFVSSLPTAGWLVVQSSSVSYGRATPYLPVIQMLRDYLKISTNDSIRSIRESLANKILALDPALHDAIPPLLDLLDTLEENHPFRSLDLALRRQHTYQAVVRLILAEARARPVVAVFEDLHWNDSLSLGLLNELVVAAQAARFLLLVSYRPEYRDEWRHRPNYRQIRLDPLASHSLTGFLRALLGSEDSLAPLKTFLVERANGNPLFAEEIVRRLIDTGTLGGARGNYHLARPFSGSDVPPTVQAILAARIDALPQIEKRLLQEAAVVGYQIPVALLHAICSLTENELHGCLENLQASEFLYMTQLSPERQYSFKHAFTHEVTYSGVLHERRREIHARIVDAAERLYADRLSENIERLSHHALRGDLKEKAVDYLRQAAVKAAARSAITDARERFEQALNVLKTLPENQTTMQQAFELRVELRPVLRQLGEVRQMLEHLREAETLAEHLKDDRRRGRVCGLMTTVLSTLNELDEAVVTGARALEIAQRIQEPQLGIVATGCLEQAHYYRGEFARVVQIAIENLAAIPDEWEREYFGLAVPLSVFSRGWLVMSLAELGRFAEAAKYEAEAIRLAESTEHAHTIGWARLTSSMLHFFEGDWARARALVEHWTNIPRTLDVAVLLPWAIASSAWALAQIGDSREALARVREGEQLLERQTTLGIVGHRSWAYQALGRACMILGRLDEAKRLGTQALESAKRQPGFAAHAHHLLAESRIQSGRFDAESAATHYRQAISIAEQHGMRPLVAHCHIGLSQLCRHAGERERAHEHLEAATTMYREMHMGFSLNQGQPFLNLPGANESPGTAKMATEV
jgi:class 3 adenylate cyclase/tetratricopeptide (TPR) repeat protein